MKMVPISPARIDAVIEVVIEVVLWSVIGVDFWS